jgi:mRNA interferase MazF
MVTDYIPDRGDAVWLVFDPQAGHEQAGRRPAIVLSPQAYNAKSSLSIVCPITSRVKGYPFEVTLPSNFPIQGVILSDQIKSLDWKVRKAEFIGPLPVSILDEVIAKLKSLLDINNS